MIALHLALAVSVSSASPPASTPKEATIHASWTSLLRDHVRGDLVDYDAFAKSSVFQEYLKTLANTRIETAPRAEQAAFWINVYNAYTIELINKKKERESIRNVNALLGLLRGSRPWKEEIVSASRRLMSLEDVEKLLFREFKNPRIHFALVKAARSSPPLRQEAYEGASLDSQLEDQTRTFLKERQVENRLDLGNHVIHLSRIFDWQRKDFGGSNAAILKFVAPYFEGRAEEAAFSGSRLTIEWSEFDWTLNLLLPRETQ